MLKPPETTKKVDVETVIFAILVILFGSHIERNGLTSARTAAFPGDRFQGPTSQYLDDVIASL